MKIRTLCATLLLLFVVTYDVDAMILQQEQSMLAHENLKKMRESDFFSIIDIIEREMPLTVESAVLLGFEVCEVEGDADYTRYYFDDVILQNGSRLEYMFLQFEYKKNNHTKIWFDLNFGCHEITQDMFFKYYTDFKFLDVWGPLRDMHYDYVKKIPLGRIIVSFAGPEGKTRYLKNIFFDYVVPKEKVDANKGSP